MAHARRDSAMAPTDSFGQDVPEKWESNEVRQVKAQLDDAVHGMSNEEIWMLVRRWDKEIYVLKRTSDLAGPRKKYDAHRSKDARFSPNKLRSQMERSYRDIIMGISAFLKHIARLRSWREPRRTGAFCTAYITAWLLDCTSLFLLSTLAALCLSPYSRSFLFPPAPIALTTWDTGILRKPRAGVLGSADTLTGAPENLAGEALENEASNFVAGIFAIFMDLAVEKDEHDIPDGKSDAPLAGDQDNNLVESVFTGKDRASGVDKPSHDKTKRPMGDTMWEKRMQILNFLHALSDLWERFANLLSPPPPAADDALRRSLTKVFVTMIVFSVVSTPYIVSKMFALIFGICFFSGPLLDSQILYWLDLNNTLLYNVPTNAQLTLHLLREAEQRHSPIPPPPLIRSSPPASPLPLSSDIISSTGNDYPFGATPEEILDAAASDPSLVARSGGHDSEIVRSTKDGSHRSSRATEALRHGLKAVVKVGVAVDKVKARAGNSHAKSRQGTLERPGERAVPNAERYDARYEGKKGFVYLMGAKGGKQARVSFITGPPLAEPSASVSAKGHSDPQVLWSLDVREVVKLVKHSGYGPTVVNSKTMSTWATGRQVKDGLEMVDAEGKTWALTAVGMRDQLFNRLCAMGGQKWVVE